MKIGGYQIINLKGKNLTTDVGMVYDGLYELIEGTRKPILLSGIQIDDTEYQDVFPEVSVNGSNIELRAYGKVFTVQDNNVVTVTDDENGGGGSEDTDDYQPISIGMYTDGGTFMGVTYYCSVPVNRTWAEIISNMLIRDVSVDTIDEVIYDDINFTFAQSTFNLDYSNGAFVKTTTRNSQDDDRVMNTSLYLYEDGDYTPCTYLLKPTPNGRYVNYHSVI